VLLTNDGPLAHALLHPSHEVEREYVVRVRGVMRDTTLRRLAAGVELEDGRERTAPAGIDRVRSVGDTTLLNLTLIEGRKRQIRRALLALGHPVLELRRIRMGPLQLGRLASGAARPLTAQERRELLRQSGLEASRARSSGGKQPRRRRKARSSKQPREDRVSD
jgi:23S rRNA pseudouridine2605 synthase